MKIVKFDNPQQVVVQVTRWGHMIEVRDADDNKRWFKLVYPKGEGLHYSWGDELEAVPGDDEVDQ